MITRAIITKVDLDRAKLQVRIPIFHGVDNSANSPYADFELCWASILCTPGVSIDYREGDVVMVGFEDNDAGQPIVLGFLMLRDHLDAESRIYGDFQQLSVQEKFQAPIDTVIGKTSYQELFESIEATAGSTNSSTGG